MLTKRIIPCLDVDAGRVVKGISFIEIRDAGDPVELSSYYDAEGADELCTAGHHGKLGLQGHHGQHSQGGG